MKRLILFLSIISIALPTWADEYLRPTADASSTASCNSQGGTAWNTSMSAVYASKSGVGPTGASVTTSGTFYTFDGRVFTTLQTTSNSYSAFYINVSMKISTVAFIYACYSTNSGSTWTLFGTGTTSQATYTATITGATPSNVQVLLVFADGVANVTAYDIWTRGVIATTQTTRHPHLYLSLFQHKRKPQLLLASARGN